MDKRIAFLKKQLLANLRHLPTIEELARFVNLSESHLQQLFKREFGMPPLQYLRRLRLEKARQLLEESFKNVKEIGFAVGMADQTHFTRAFKDKFGLTPSEYRKQYWAKLEAEESEADKS